MPAQITQSNVRLLIPGKAAGVAMLIAEKRAVPPKTALLERHGVALYDVIERCSIIGSADSTIRDVVPADLRPILEESHVEDRIFVNGGTAARLYEKYLQPNLEIAARRLPSTSPANAAWSFERLLAAWGKELNPVLGKR